MASIVLARVLAYALPAAGMSCRDEARAPMTADMERVLPRHRMLVQNENLNRVLVRRGAAHDSDINDEPSPASPSPRAGS